jgi:hypothetical protein
MAGWPPESPVIDYFTLALTHGLMAVALWRLLMRDDLDREPGGREPRRPWRKSHPDA